MTFLNSISRRNFSVPSGAGVFCSALKSRGHKSTSEVGFSAEMLKVVIFRHQHGALAELRVADRDLAIGSLVVQGIRPGGRDP